MDTGACGRGAPVARNHGLDAASGPPMTFLDSAGVWYPDTLAILAPLAEERGIARGNTRSRDDPVRAFAPIAGTIRSRGIMTRDFLPRSVTVSGRGIGAPASPPCASQDPPMCRGRGIGAVGHGPSRRRLPLSAALARVSFTAAVPVAIGRCGGARRSGLWGSCGHGRRAAYHVRLGPWRRRSRLFKRRRRRNRAFASSGMRYFREFETRVRRGRADIREVACGDNDTGPAHGAGPD